MDDLTKQIEERRKTLGAIESSDAIESSSAVLVETYMAIAAVAALAAVALDRPAVHTRLTTSRTWWAAYGNIVVFQLLTNGWLTGRRIVRYDPHAIIGSARVRFVGEGRLVYAPLEDLGFGFALVLTTCVMWVWLGQRRSEERALRGLCSRWSSVLAMFRG